MSEASDQEGGVAYVRVTVVARFLTEGGPRTERQRWGREGGDGGPAAALVLVQDALQASLHGFVELLLQLLLLGHGQLGLVIPHNLVDVRGALRAMQHQCPLLQHPLLGRAPDKPQLQGPGSSGVFPPSVGGHERPLVKAHLGVVIPWTPAQQDGLGAHRGSHVDVQVSSPGGIDCDDSLDVLKVADEIFFPLTRIGGEAQHQLASGWYFPEGQVMRRYGKGWAHVLRVWRQLWVSGRAGALGLISQTHGASLSTLPMPLTYTFCVEGKWSRCCSRPSRFFHSPSEFTCSCGSHVF